LAKEDKDKMFHLTCNSRKLIYPREFLLAGSVIRPEDMEIFEQMGIKYFKITGRSKPKNWLPEVVEAYQNRNYNGNLIRLLGIAPETHADEWIYINNKSLNGFLRNYPQTGNYSDEVKYCDSWIIKLYKKGNFKLLDGSRYEVEKGTLRLSRAGERARYIIEKEMVNF
jgi:collagenase-like PrtC family protease